MDIGIGKFVALLLRHKPEIIGLTLDPQGWADVDQLIDKINQKSPHSVTLTQVEELVRNDDKARFTFSSDGKKIRANQGHSIGVDVELKEMVPPDVLYHGTAEKYMKDIQEGGLLPKTRLYVHLSSNLETATTVGKRHGELVIYRVDCKGMKKGGYHFFLSENGVWLTKCVPVEYLQKLDK